jgi:adenine-specific DNA-methyltransferase
MATLNFKGKSAVWNHHLSVPYHTLEKDTKKSLKGENDGENLIIEGDNLLALKALLPQYQGKIKCIYIDPPYNTGNEGWVYSDNVSSPTIKEWVGKTVGKEGEDLTRHDKWLCMMTPRLKLLRELLSEDGAIFVNIDDNEQHHLRMLLGEIFGEENFIATYIWEARAGKDHTAQQVSVSHEYIHLFAKDIQRVTVRKDERVQTGGNYTDEQGAYRREQLRQWGTHDLREDRPSMFFPVTAPDGSLVFPIREDGKEGCWRISKARMKKTIEDGNVDFVSDGKRWQLYAKKRDGKITKTAFGTLLQGVGTASTGTLELKAIFTEKVFDTVKPTGLIKHLLKIVDDPNAIVLDSFAGSGTTAHALLDLNKEDAGNRKCILVEMENYANTITAERVRRVTKNNKYATGFTYNTLGRAIDAENLLAGKLPSYKEFAKYVYYLGTGKNHPDEAKIKEQDAFVGKGENESIYALYKPSMETLKTLAITLDWAQETQKKDKGRKIVYAPACYLDDETLDQYGIKFVSIPYNLFERAV